jgi:hypothetical protein
VASGTCAGARGAIATGVTRAIWIGVSVLLSSGCLDYEDDSIQFAEDFENDLAMWNQAGDVTIVTTNHPGEHAVRLGVGATIARGIQITREMSGSDNPYGSEGFTDGNWIEYSSDCAGRPSLALEAMTTPPVQTTPVRVRLVLEGPPVEDTFTRDRLMFPALPDYVVPEPDPWNEQTDSYSLTFGQIVVGTNAPCRVDNLRIMVSGGTLGY